MEFNIKDGHFSNLYQSNFESRLCVPAKQVFLNTKVRDSFCYRLTVRVVCYIRNVIFKCLLSHICKIKKSIRQETDIVLPHKMKPFKCFTNSL